MTNRTIARFSPVCVVFALAASMLTAQGLRVVHIFVWPHAALMHAEEQGYLGVDLSDVDQEHQQQLHLTELRGALITLIDHDAPAGKIGLHVNDVILQVNGQKVEGSDDARKLLHQIPPGHKVQLTVSRNGKLLHFEAQLADRKIIARSMQQQIQSQELNILGNAGMGMIDSSNTIEPVSSGGPFHWWTGGGNLNVGAAVELLTPQMANYLGLENGLYVRMVAHKSEAEAAGLKVSDVILKVGSDAIVTIADWERALNASDGKTVQLTVQRDKKLLTMNLAVDSKRR